MSKFQNYEEKGKEIGGSSDWMKLKVGENRIKLLTEPEEYVSHYSKDENKNYTCEGENCAFCIEGTLDRRTQFIAWIIDREDGKVKLLSFGWTIFKQTGELSQSSEYGFKGEVPPYDLIIKRTGEGKSTEYFVQAARKETPLTKEEQADFDSQNDIKDIVKKMKDKNPGKVVETKKGGKKTDNEETIQDEDIPF